MKMMGNFNTHIIQIVGGSLIEQGIFLKLCLEMFTVHDLFLEIVITFVIIMNLNLQRI